MLRTNRARVVALVIALFASLGLTSAYPAIAGAGPDNYEVGVGIADITGEAAEVGMMGYARLDQVTAGIHQRQWARAFVVGQPGGRRAVFVNTDIGHLMQSVHTEVMRRLATSFGGRYNASNVMLSATHTHGGPGGFSHDTLYNLTVLGYQAKTFEAIVSGIVRSIRAADADLAPGKVKIATGTLVGANVQRSMPQFERNPAADKARFPNATDQSMTVLRFEQGGQPVGMISWFATHGTSMTGNNRLISPDNKGYAEYNFEHDMQGVDWNERGQFVAAFAQTNAGDMSPNLRDGGRLGPTDDEFENTRIIGSLQAQKARQLFDNATEELSGPVDFRQRYVNFNELDVQSKYTTDGAAHRTCVAALGQNFTAGAEDGPGPPFVGEGDLAGNPLLTLAGIVVAPTPESVRTCQLPKQVFLGLGSQRPAWSPDILPVQVMRIGQLTLSAAPAEFTIVAGHRVLDSVGAELGPMAKYQVFAGYSNAYAGYVTTPEEYDAQHYEGAATHFGKWTLPAYQQELAKLAIAMRDNQPTPSAVTPPWLGDHQLTLRIGPVLDTPPLGKRFGDVATQPAASYQRGQQVNVVFYTGHPNNNLRDEGTFLEVQQKVGNSWRTVATDNDWATIYRWKREYLSVSTAQVIWNIPADTAPGTYRIVHNGDSRSLLGRISAFTGTSQQFTVT
jgi:neutral ceramidase